MKTLRLCALSAAVAAGMGMTTASAGEGPFIGIKTGPLWMEDISLYSNGIGVDADFNTGWGVTIPVGYRFDNGVSFALTCGYYTADLDHARVRGAGRSISADLDADVTTVPIMANAGYTIPIGESFGLTIGGGIGIGYNEVDLNRVAGFGVYTNKDSWDLTWQAMAEFSYNVTGGLNVSLGYRYFSVDADQSDVRGGILEAGLIYRW